VNCVDVQLLYAYNRWANARLLDASSLLPDELLRRDVASSYRSIFETLRHIAWGEWLWLGRWQEQAPAGRNPLFCADLTALRPRWSEIERDQSQFISGLAPLDLDRSVSYENPAATRWTYSLRHMLHHVVNHSTYHRGQVAGMLRQAGTTPPATDFLLYLDAMTSA